MKKYILSSIIVMLLMAITGGVVYVIMDKKLDNNKIDNSSDNLNNTDIDNKNSLFVEDGVKLKDIKQDGDKVIESLEITLNGKTKIMEIVYTYSYSDWANGSCNIIGKYNGHYFEHGIEICNSEVKFNLLEKIKSSYKNENYQLIKGKDNKNYLLIRTNNDDIFVYNENLELISKDAIEDDYKGGGKKSSFTTANYYTNVVSKLDTNKNVWYSNENYCDNHKDVYGGCNVTLKIEGNKIYYLALNITELNYSETGYGTLEERVYTINNNKLEYETINGYKVLEIENMI